MIDRAQRRHTGHAMHWTCHTLDMPHAWHPPTCATPAPLVRIMHCSKWGAMMGWKWSLWWNVYHSYVLSDFRRDSEGTNGYLHLISLRLLTWVIHPFILLLRVQCSIQWSMCECVDMNSVENDAAKWVLAAVECHRVSQTKKKLAVPGTDTKRSNDQSSTALMHSTCCTWHPPAPAMNTLHSWVSCAAPNKKRWRGGQSLPQTPA